jgi:hypothetical protein
MSTLYGLALVMPASPCGISPALAARLASAFASARVLALLREGFGAGLTSVMASPERSDALPSAFTSARFSLPPDDIGFCAGLAPLVMLPSFDADLASAFTSARLLGCDAASAAVCAYAPDAANAVKSAADKMASLFFICFSKQFRDFDLSTAPLCCTDCVNSQYQCTRRHCPSTDLQNLSSRRADSHLCRRRPPVGQHLDLADSVQTALELRPNSASRGSLRRVAFGHGAS